MSQSYLLHQNIERYQRLLGDPNTEATTKRVVSLLLCDAEAHLRHDSDGTEHDGGGVFPTPD